jgi:aryl-alcohol dehydrogenase-like predicted oxidoreductase
VIIGTHRGTLDRDRPQGVTFRGISLGCGNFGGIGSAPEFFGQGIPEDEAFAIMDRAWGAGIRWFDSGDAYCCRSASNTGSRMSRLARSQADG